MCFFLPDTYKRGRRYEIVPERHCGYTLGDGVALLVSSNVLLTDSGAASFGNDRGRISLFSSGTAAMNCSNFAVGTVLRPTAARHACVKAVPYLGVVGLWLNAIAVYLPVDVVDRRGRGLFYPLKLVTTMLNAPNLMRQRVGVVVKQVRYRRRQRHARAGYLDDVKPTASSDYAFCGHLPGGA